MTEQTMTSKQLSNGKQIQSGKAPMTAERRAEIDAVLESRIRELLAARDGDFAEKFPRQMKEPEMTGNLWLWAISYRAFLDTRGRKVRQEADAEFGAILQCQPQTRGGKSALRCRDLLFRLIYQGAQQKGLL